MDVRAKIRVEVSGIPLIWFFAVYSPPFGARVVLRKRRNWFGVNEENIPFVNKVMRTFIFSIYKI